MKKEMVKAWLFIFVLSVFIVSCGTLGSVQAGEAEILITRIDTLKKKAEVYLDGKQYNLSAGESRLIKIPNGNHTLEVSYQNFTSERVIITAGSDRSNIKIDVRQDNQKPQNYVITIHREEPTTMTITGNNLEAAVHRAYENIIKDMPDQSRLALINIASEDEKDGEFVLDELTDLLVNSKRYNIVDRRSLDSLRAERNFQMTGEVDDNSAVDIGKLLGAEIVITGSITGTTDKRLRIKALGVETARIMIMDTQKFSGGLSGFIDIFKKDEK
jgi:hypothetical protein